MATVFFKLNDQQDKELKNLMEEEGYSNKAEFFRFLIKFFKYTRPLEELQFEKASHELASVLKALNQKSKFGKSIEEQLSDV